MPAEDSPQETQRKWLAGLDRDMVDFQVDNRSRLGPCGGVAKSPVARSRQDARQPPSASEGRPTRWTGVNELSKPLRPFLLLPLIS